MKRLFLALLSPIVALALLEGILTVAGVAPRPRFFRSRDSANQASEQLELCARTPWGPSPPFQPLAFPRHKPEGVFRIFCLGASTVNGTPFSRHCSFSDWLRVRLEELHPERRFEVMRMAADARTARDIALLCEEVVDYEPDLLIVYTGHNEFLFANLPRLRHPGKVRLRDRLFSLRTGRLMADLFSEAAARVTGPIKNPRRVIADEPFLSRSEIEQGYLFYAEGIERIVQACRDAGIPLLVCRPACNLRDYEPRRSFLDPQLGAAGRTRFRGFFAEGSRLLDERQIEAALEQFEQARSIDPTPAILHFRTGQCLIAIGRQEEARAEFIQARDLDNHTNRATSRHQRLIEQIAGGYAILADCQSFFDSASKSGIAGDDLFVDNVHPDLDAQNLIAEAVLRSLSRTELIAPPAKWSFSDEPSVAEYRRRIGVDLHEMATNFTEYALANLVQVFGRPGAADPLDAAERLARFALRYDPRNATAQFCIGLVAAHRGEKKQARENLAQSWSEDPGVLTEFLAAAQHNAKLIPLAAPLGPLLPGEPAPRDSIRPDRRSRDKHEPQE